MSHVMVANKMFCMSQDMDIVTMERYSRNSYALYRMMLFPVTLNDPISYPKPLHFRHFVSPFISS